MTKNNLEEYDIDVQEIIMKILGIINSYKKIITIIMILGVLGGVTNFLIKKPLYESEMVLSSEEMLSYPAANTIIEALQKTIKDYNYLQLSTKLNLSQNDARCLKSVELEKIYEVNDETEIKTFKITVSVSNPEILPKLEQGIVKYLEENPYVKKRVEINRQNFKAQIEFVKGEMAELQNLKGQILEGDGILKDQKGNLIMFNPVSVYENALKLFTKELELQRELELIENFQVIQSFTIFQRPSSPKLAVNLVLGLTCALILNLIVVFWLEFRSYFKKIKDKSNAAAANVA